MELSGETLIEATQQAVWDALNDPAILSQCIDGCQTLERIGDDRFEGSVVAKVGPVKATFQGIVTLTALDAPNSYVLLGEGKGGIAGFAKGSARVVLTSAEHGRTNLSYTANAAVGGKLAQLGARLIEATARDYAQKFFNTFKAIVELGDAPQAGGPVVAADQTMTDVKMALVPVSGSGLPVWLWSGGLILLCGVLLMYLTHS